MFELIRISNIYNQQWWILVNEQGLQARVLYQMPSTAICWTVYEFFKYLLTKDASQRSVRNESIAYDKIDVRSSSSSSSALSDPRQSLGGLNQEDIRPASSANAAY